MSIDLKDYASKNPERAKKLASIKKQSSLDQFESYEAEWITLDNVEPKNQPWFWCGIIPSHTITLFAGYGGIGKSLLLLFLLAKTTTGEKFSAGGIEHQLPQGSVILLSAEDDPEYHIVPKLMAMNADLSKVHFIKSKVGIISKRKRFLELDKDLHLLQQRIDDVRDVKFIVIDPVAYFLGDVNDHVNVEVANFLHSLIELAKEKGITILLNKHLRKQASGAKGISSATDEVSGSNAWTNTPRRSWLISNHPENDKLKVITKLKDNLGEKEETALAYTIKSTSINFSDKNIQTTHLIWEEKMVNITSDEVVSEVQFQATKEQKCIKFIYSYLQKKGQSYLKEVRSDALKLGYTQATWDRAFQQFKSLYGSNLKEDAVGNQKLINLIEV